MHVRGRSSRRSFEMNRPQHLLSIKCNSFHEIGHHLLTPLSMEQLQPDELIIEVDNRKKWDEMLLLRTMSPSSMYALLRDYIPSSDTMLCVCVVCMYDAPLVDDKCLYVCMCAYMCVCMYVSMYACVCMYVCKFMFVCMQSEWVFSCGFRSVLSMGSQAFQDSSISAAMVIPTIVSWFHIFAGRY